MLQRHASTRHRIGFASALFFGCLSFDRDAAAEVESPQEDLSAPHEEAAPSSAKASRDATSWYGWQIWAVDAGTVSLGMGSCIAARSPSPMIFFGSVFMLSGSIIHAFHGRGMAALGSFGLRAIVPLTASLVALVSGVGRGLEAFSSSWSSGFFSSSSSSSSSSSGRGKDAYFDDLGGNGAVAAIGVHAMLVSLIDGAFLAYANQSSKPSLGSAKPQWYPTATVGPKNANVGFAGTF